MKSMSVRLSLGFLLASLLCGAASAQPRIGTVDLRKVFDGYWKTKEADARLKDNATDMEKEFKTMVTEFDKSKEDYQKLLSGANDQAISQDERDKRKKSAEDKLKQLKETEDGITQYRRQATNTLEEKKKRMRDNILGEIRTVLNAKSKSSSFTLVVDVAAESANSTPVILYSNNDSDITDDVLKQLNATAPASAPAAAPKSEDIKKNERKK